jgi:hypothetical protein
MTAPRRPISQARRRPAGLQIISGMRLKRLESVAEFF